MALFHLPEITDSSQDRSLRLPGRPHRCKRRYHRMGCPARRDSVSSQGAALCAVSERLQKARRWMKNRRNVLRSRTGANGDDGCDKGESFMPYARLLRLSSTSDPIPSASKASEPGSGAAALARVPLMRKAGVGLRPSKLNGPPLSETLTPESPMLFTCHAPVDADDAPAATSQ